MAKVSYEVRWGHSRVKTAHGGKRREERRKDAERRQTEYDKLTTQQKLERLTARVGEAGGARERTKLLDTIAAQNLEVVKRAVEQREKREGKK
jgi:hypothetical protein